jgi:uncharacterized protein (TIGR02145 family)
MKHLGYIIACFVILLNVHLVNAQGDVKIGTQIWTSKNLDVSTFRNGEAIPEAKNAEEWAKVSENEKPAFCYYNFDTINRKVYGKLYNWYAVNDPRGLAPYGWHIPDDSEWTELIEILGGEDLAAIKLKSNTGWSEIVGEKIAGFKMSAKDGWKKGKKSGNGNNKSGFNGVPGGCMNDGEYFELTKTAYWWSSKQWDTGLAWCRYIDNDCFGQSHVVSKRVNESNFLSVRCIKD